MLTQTRGISREVYGLRSNEGNLRAREGQIENQILIAANVGGNVPILREVTKVSF
jgi:hypothetical protein